MRNILHSIFDDVHENREATQQGMFDDLFPIQDRNVLITGICSTMARPLKQIS